MEAEQDPEADGKQRGINESKSKAKKRWVYYLLRIE